MAKDRWSYYNALLEYSEDNASWVPIECPRSIQVPNEEGAVIDATCIDDQGFIGLPGQAQEATGGFTALYDPQGAEITALRTFRRNGTNLYWRITPDDGTNQPTITYQGRISGLTFSEGNATTAAEYTATITPSTVVLETPDPGP